MTTLFSRIRMLFRSLYWRLSLTLVVLLTVLAFAYMYVSTYTAEMYFQETNQRLNASVAPSLAQDLHLIVRGKLDQQAVAKLFDNAMVINPSVEVYLVNLEGKLIAYSAPDSVIKRSSVRLGPILKFLEGDGSTFVMGDDPRGADREKAFSAARLEHDGVPEGYLYVILGGKEYESAAQLLLGSYILRLGLLTTSLTLLVAAIIGLVAFRLITKSLRATVRTVQAFRDGNRHARIPASTDVEIQELATTFNDMADTLVAQIAEIRTMDALRRDLVANVSHDLRTPLVSIHGYVETILMKSQTLTEGEVTRYLTTVLQNTERLKKLVEELFELSRLEARERAPQLEQFSLEELVQDVVHKHQVIAEAHALILRTDSPHDLPFVTADIGLIERVFQNLLDNAIKYTPDGGEISIRLAARGNAIRVHIVDTGQGIPPEELTHIFDRYHRGNQLRRMQSSGAGLGLAIVKQILDVHGISIEVSSRVNEGTSFIFDLPVATAGMVPAT